MSKYRERHLGCKILKGNNPKCLSNAMDKFRLYGGINEQESSLLTTKA